MIRPKKVDPNILRGISNMSKQDQEQHHQQKSLGGKENEMGVYKR